MPLEGNPPDHRKEIHRKEASGGVVKRYKPTGGSYSGLKFTTLYYATENLLPVGFLAVVWWLSHGSGVRWRSNYYFLLTPR